MKAQEKAAIIHAKISQLYPEAHCELNYSNSTELMVAIMLSQQATDLSVNRLTTQLFKKYRALEDYASKPLGELELDIRTIGLYKNKAKNIRQMAQKVIYDHEGVFPNDQEKLEMLPGVGRKTANVFLAEWYHEPRIAVDTHVSRVAKRLGLAKEKDTPEKVEARLMQLYDRSLWIETHHKLLFFGRYFCKAIKPKCHECPLVDICLKPQL